MDITQLGVDQLHQLRKSIADEIQLISNSYANLKIAAARFNHSLEGISEMNEGNRDQELLVPLTSSMYIPGTLNDITTVMVDCGTGYYIKKPVEEADVYIQKKIQMVQANMDKIQMTLIQKRKDLDAVGMVVNAKMEHMKAQQAKQVVEKAIIE